jgi:hypothetical protein
MELACKAGNAMSVTAQINEAIKKVLAFRFQVKVFA